MNYRKLLGVVVGIGAMVVVCVCGGYFAIHAQSPGNGKAGAYTYPKIDETKLYEVSDVVDGDTFKVRVEGRSLTVRMLGMNTPETVDPRKAPECYGKEASDETKSLLDGEKVRLVHNPNRETHDKYGRELLYVYRDDGMFVNEFLVKGGFAREYTVGKPYEFQAEFRADEAAAKAAGKGLWGKCPLVTTD